MMANLTAAMRRLSRLEWLCLFLMALPAAILVLSVIGILRGLAIEMMVERNLVVILLASIVAWMLVVRMLWPHMQRRAWRHWKKPRHASSRAASSNPPAKATPR